MSEPSSRKAADVIISTLQSGSWATADLVRIAHAVGQFGTNSTSILGQYGEELVAEAFNGIIAPFDQKAYDVRTPHHGDLQVKTFSRGKKPGVIRSFAHDVVTLEIDGASATVIQARHYAATDLIERFQMKFTSKYAGLGLTWAGEADSRFERGWRIEAGVPFTDITHLFNEEALD